MVMAFIITHIAMPKTGKNWKDIGLKISWKEKQRFGSGITLSPLISIRMMSLSMEHTIGKVETIWRGIIMRDAEMVYGNIINVARFMHIGLIRMENKSM